MKASQRWFAASALALTLAVLVLAAVPNTTQASAPSANPAQYGTPGGFSCIYIVRPGDNLFRISLRFGVSPFTIAALNGLFNLNLIFAGMVLRVPCAFPPSPQPSPISTVCNIYFVRPGDWLKLIAARFAVPWQVLAAINRLPNPNFIFPGERLVIPCFNGVRPYAPGGNPYGSGVNPYGPGTNPYGPGTNPYATPAPAPAPGAGMVNIQNLAYHPAMIMIHVGQMVMWRNLDSVQHSATQGTCSGSTCTPTPGGFDTGILNGGQASGGITFNMTGTFHYFCRIHGAMMQGDVVVMP